MTGRRYGDPPFSAEELRRAPVRERMLMIQINAVAGEAERMAERIAVLERAMRHKGAK